MENCSASPSTNTSPHCESSPRSNPKRNSCPHAYKTCKRTFVKACSQHENLETNQMLTKGVKMNNVQWDPTIQGVLCRKSSSETILCSVTHSFQHFIVNIFSDIKKSGKNFKVSMHKNTFYYCYLLYSFIHPLSTHQLIFFWCISVYFAVTSTHRQTTGPKVTPNLGDKQVKGIIAEISLPYLKQKPLES